MSATSATPTISLRRLGLLLAWLALGLYFVTPVTRVLEPDLDSSIHASYAYLTAHGFQFGPEVNTTAGPYGFVMFGWDFGGELFWTRLALVVVFSFTLSALSLWFFSAARGGTWRWVWLGAMVFELSITDTLFTAAVGLAGLFLIANYSRSHRRGTSLLVAVFLPFLALMKGTQLAECLVVALAIALTAAASRSWRRACELGLAGLFALVAWWGAAGQDPVNLPSYFNGLRHIAEGYNEAMVLETPTALLYIGLGQFAGLALLFAATGWRHRAHPAMLGSSALLAGLTFVLWKHGFLRSDDHILIFVDFASVAALTVPVLYRGLGLTPDSLAFRFSRGLLVAAICALSVAGSQSMHPDRLKGLVRGVGSRYWDNLGYLTHADLIEESREHDLARNRRLYDLPVVRGIVRDRPLDFFGYQLGLVFLNGFNYRPAPMCCGTYHVYNQYFKERNQRHYVDPLTRPEFVLLKIQSIDSRFAAMDDSLSLLALLGNYHPASYEDDTLLLQAKPGVATSPAPHVLATHRIRFGEEMAVPAVAPDQLLLFSVSLPASIRGEVRAFVYKPPLLFLDTYGEGLSQAVNQRVIAASLASPSLLTPPIEDTADFVALLAGHNRKRISSFRLHTPQPECFAEESMTVTFYTHPRPPPFSDRDLRKVRAHAVFGTPPDEVIPAEAVIGTYHGMRVQYLNAPASVTYHLKGDERAITFVGGMDENSYLHGRTDGVDLIIELEQPGLPRQTLDRLALHPLANPADRGLHRLTAYLPPAFAPGSKLIVRSDPGPAGDAAWDWVIASYLGITRGPFRLEQFPGFLSLPTTAVGSAVGRHLDGARFVTVASPPAEFVFPLTGAEQTLHLTGGMFPGSYLEGQTDGAEITVELESPDGKTQRLFERWLQPGIHAADRGDQAMVVKIPTHPSASRLHLRTNFGAAGNGAWDWVYLSYLRLN